MWDRTKRLINSYLDNMIEKVNSPDDDVRKVTRMEVTRLNEVEVQATAAAKMLEKELAEVNLKLLGLAERERIMREQGNDASAANAASAIQTLSAQRDLLMQQISEAKASIAKAKALREERKVQGSDLANEVVLTQMRENIAGLNSSFDPLDPSGTIDEMRSRLGRSSYQSIESKVAEADAEMKAAETRSRVDDMLAQYKNQPGGEVIETRSPQPTQTRTPETANPSKLIDEEGEEQKKTLGRSEGKIRPLD